MGSVAIFCAYRQKESVLAKLNEKKEEIAIRSGKKSMQKVMEQDIERSKK